MDITGEIETMVDNNETVEHVVKETIEYSKKETTTRKVQRHRQQYQRESGTTKRKAHHSTPEYGK